MHPPDCFFLNCLAKIWQGGDSHENVLNLFFQNSNWVSSNDDKEFIRANKEARYKIPKVQLVPLFWFCGKPLWNTFSIPHMKCYIEISLSIESGTFLILKHVLGKVIQVKWVESLLYINQSIDLQSKYDGDFHYEILNTSYDSDWPSLWEFYIELPCGNKYSYS